MEAHAENASYVMLVSHWEQSQVTTEAKRIFSVAKEGESVVGEMFFSRF